LLVELSIANFVIIDALHLTFQPGFTVLTGETGTGKSILIDAVSLLLGGRSSIDVIRAGFEQAAVEGVFILDPDTVESLRPLLEELGLWEGSNELILRREITRSKRGVCRINNRAVTLNSLEEVGRHLVDIHGQGEHLSLLQARRHIDFLDRYAGLQEERRTFGAVVHRLRGVREELRNLRSDARELARRIDLLSFQTQEIRSANLRPEEEEELRRERNLLANAEKLMRLAGNVYEMLTGGEEGRGGRAQRAPLVDQLGSVVSDLAALSKLDDTLAEHTQAVENMLYQVEELARTMRNYRAGVEYDPQRLQVVEERIDLVQSLKRKYGDSISEVLAFADRAQEELDAISHSEERGAALEAEEKALLAEIAERGAALSQARREAGGRLRSAVEAELAELSMERARFLVDQRWAPAPDGPEIEGTRYGFDESGLDRLEFFIAANPGEEPKPLARTASGGETSRLMLAMKTALSAADPVPTLIFDEIDAGIGGRAGNVVGRKLSTVAHEHQVFCVTHLAQIASYGDQHCRVVKNILDGRTISTTQELSPAERIDELATMLGGAVTEANRQSASELIRRAQSTDPTAKDDEA
jgi:DNA repair protein RecN (Recombination protein N)